MDKEERFVKRNLDGIRLEKAGQIEKAIRLYSQNVAEGFDGSHPYDRLRIIYERQAKKKNDDRLLQAAIDVCRAYIAIHPVSQRPYYEERYGKHIKRLEKKLAKKSPNLEPSKKRAL